MISSITIRRRSLLAAGAAGLATPSLLRAQERFPSRPIEVVTHAGVGGGTDLTARMMMVQAPAEFGVELVVVNRTGGSGAAALGYAAGKPKDGHTLLLVTQTHILTMIRSKTPTQFEDLVGVARATEDPQVLLVRKDSPLRTKEDLLKAGKERALKVGITNIGGTDHVALASFARTAGIRMPTAVPFRGGADIAINIVGGNIEAGLVNPGETDAQLRAGEVRGLLAMSEKRLPGMPDTPTAREVGIDAVYATSRGFAVLKGTPEDRIAKLEEGLIKSMQGQMFQAFLTNSGQSPDSVAGRAVWQAQLDRTNAEAKQILPELGLI
jgi:tripartite-type tricarboxylate transporter receptor subunit TctC